MILSVEGLTFQYPSHTILNDVSFTLNQGECAAILGVNGAGKSTLLKCINHILKPKVGTVFIEKQNAYKLTRNQLARQIGYIAQTNHTFPTTVFDTILIGRKPYIKWNVSKEDLHIVQNVMRLLKLEDFSLRYIDELSGGEFQKVLVARALAQQPKILMLDEPTSNLDLKNQLEIIDTIKEIVRSEGISAIITIHDLNLALRFADKFILLKDSKIFAAGGTEVITAENIASVYSVRVAIEDIAGETVVVPL